jgi:16S rRNA (cytosine967-C5)-methyltransferase
MNNFYKSENANARLYGNLITALADILHDSFIGGFYADKVIERHFKLNKQWGARDRHFIAFNSYEMIRWWRLLHFLNQSDYEKPSSQSINACVGIWLFISGYKPELIQNFLTPLHTEKIQSQLESANNVRAIKESIPDWLDEIGFQQLGDRWNTEIFNMNHQAPIYIRINSLKTNKPALTTLLKNEDITSEEVEIANSALKISGRPNLFRTESFKNGLFEVQDAGSQLIAPFMELYPGMRVCDACAGAGGKTLHIANLMNNTGKIIAMDIYEHKLKELHTRAVRNGIANVEVRVINGKRVKRLKESFDRLLLDVPCTGIGVLKRNPDSKWKLSPDFLGEVLRTQEEILEKYSTMVKPGGKMVYATCSLLPMENRAQVDKFLERNKNFVLEEDHELFPSQHNTDGFYMARMLKK